MSITSKPATSTGPSRPAGIAQHVLRFITEQQLPPTPKVYELWYRYFEGADECLNSELAVRVEDPSSIDLELVESLHAQYCMSPAVKDNRIVDRLADEIVGFKLIVQDQKSAGESYSRKLAEANQVFIEAVPQKVAETASSLTDDTRQMQSELEKLHQRVVAAEEQVDSLQAELQEAHSAMMTDHLTGLGNRRFYESLLRQSIRSLNGREAEGVPYLALVDCDKFKSVNDNFGHPFGDTVIKTLGAELSRVVSNGGVARLGGDEFAAFGRFRSDDEVAAFADDLRTAIGGQKLFPPESLEPLKRLTLSIGIARVRAEDSEESWHDRADKMLYQAKHLGGDRAVIEKTLGRNS